MTEPASDALPAEGRIARHIAMLAWPSSGTSSNETAGCAAGMLYVPLAFALAGFLWAAVAFLRLIGR